MMTVFMLRTHTIPRINFQNKIVVEWRCVVARVEENICIQMEYICNKKVDGLDAEDGDAYNNLILLTPFILLTKLLVLNHSLQIPNQQCVGSSRRYADSKSLFYFYINQFVSYYLIIFFIRKSISRSSPHATGPFCCFSAGAHGLDAIVPNGPVSTCHFQVQVGLIRHSSYSPYEHWCTLCQNTIQ